VESVRPGILTEARRRRGFSVRAPVQPPVAEYRLHRPGSPNVSGHQRFRTTPIRPQRAEFVPIPARRRFPPLVGAVVGSSLVASLIVAGLVSVGVVVARLVSRRRLTTR